MENTNLYKGEDNSALRFYTKPVKNNFHSERVGRPVYDTGLYVEVITPGSAESQPEFLCELTFSMESGSTEGQDPTVKKYEPYCTKYAAQIESFKRQTGAYIVDGTPITQWPQIDVGTATTLNAIGILTVEQLAGVSDGNLGNLGTGGRTLREKAKQFIQSREFCIPTAQAGTEIADLNEKLQAAHAEIASLRAQLAAAQATPAVPAPAPFDFGALVSAQGQTELAPAPALGDALAALSGPSAAPLVSAAPATVI
jgi:hypothetical protein